MKNYIEIGSCYFNTLTHLSTSLGWNGTIVEPIKKFIDKLPQLNNVQYLNYAIDTERGTRDMYLFQDEIAEDDQDFHGMSSLYHNHGDKQYRLQVNTITYKDLLYLTGYKELELLKIDTEGHDLIILKEALRQGNPIPQRIIVEHKHVDANEMLEVLLHFGYDVTKDEENYYGRLGE
jgi:FkbM family methyltransferase